MIENLLFQPQPNLNSNQQGRLFLDFILRMRELGIKERENPAQFRDMMKTDKYLSALRVSFGYALTCHKAQGGEWKYVYACFPCDIMLNPTKHTCQWVYTVLTRAKEKFYGPDDIYIEGFRS